GLLDDIAMRSARPLSPAQRQRQQDLNGKLTQLERQITAFVSKKELTEPDRTELQQLTKQRAAAEADLAQLAAELARDEVYDLPRIQAQLPADAALLAWVDIQALPKAADPNGEHWACVVRRRGIPLWVKLPGSGPGGAWTQDDDQLPQRGRQALSQPP